MKPIHLLPAILLLCFLVPACGSPANSSTKTGTVTGLVLVRESNEMLAEVKLDDGTKIYAAPKIFYETENASGWKLAQAGQRVEVELVEKATADHIAKWKILREIETGK